jgi:hypothetical protein
MLHKPDISRVSDIEVDFSLPAERVIRSLKARRFSGDHDPNRLRRINHAPRAK